MKKQVHKLKKIHKEDKPSSLANHWCYNHSSWHFKRWECTCGAKGHWSYYYKYPPDKATWQDRYIKILWKRHAAAYFEDLPEQSDLMRAT